MNFFPRVIRVDRSEAVIHLPDAQVDITFRCDSKDLVAVTTVFEVARMSTKARRGCLPSISSERRQAARRLAVDAILRYRRDYAERQVEKYRRPFQPSFKF